MAKMIALGLIAVGVLVFLSSFAWYSMMDNGVAWTPEQGKEREQSVSKAHQSAVAMATAKTTKQKVSLKAEADKSLAKAKKTKAEFDRAQMLRSTVPSVLRYIGSGLALVGAIAFLVVTKATEN